MLFPNAIGKETARSRVRQLEPSLIRHLRNPETQRGLDMSIEQWFYSLPSRLRSFFLRDQVDQEMKEELHEHLENRSVTTSREACQRKGRADPRCWPWA